MTDPTPTRAEVDADLRNAARKAKALMDFLDLKGASRTTLHRLVDTCERAARENQVLRERAEAAEHETAMSQPLFSRRMLEARLVELNAALTASRRAEAAAWNDAIEAAAQVADGIYREAAEYRLPLMAVGASKCRDDIRALRRAAPTEGEA